MPLSSGAADPQQLGWSERASMARWAAALKGVLPGRTGKGNAQPRAKADQHRAQDTTPDPPAGATVHSYAPVVWLLGKVQSGKTSIIRAVTGASDAEIGDGFR